MESQMRLLKSIFAALGGASIRNMVAAESPSGQSASQARLQQVAVFEHQVTGVTVSKDGRIFVNFPRWTEDNEVSVAELKDGKLIPFPDAEWNAWRNAKKDEVSAKDHWICVQSTVADHQGNIW